MARNTIIPSKKVKSITTDTNKVHSVATGNSSVISNIGSSIVSGMAFGTGSAIANKAIGSIFGTGQNPVSVESQNASSNVVISNHDSCINEYKNFMRCIQDNNNNIKACDYYMKNLEICCERLENKVDVNNGSVAYIERDISLK